MNLKILSVVVLCVAILLIKSNLTLALNKMDLEKLREELEIDEGVSRVRTESKPKVW